MSNKIISAKHWCYFFVRYTKLEMFMLRKYLLSWMGNFGCIYTATQVFEHLLTGQTSGQCQTELHLLHINSSIHVPTSLIYVIHMILTFWRLLIEFHFVCRNARNGSCLASVSWKISSLGYKKVPIYKIDCLYVKFERNVHFVLKHWHVPFSFFVFEDIYLFIE